MRIDKLDWMAPATKAEAKRKLATLKVGVGYPDHWIDYSGAEGRRPATRSATPQRAELFEYRRNLAKFGHPVDRGEWAMTPQTVNAVNLPVRNALNFPAAILQAPDFDPRQPDRDEPGRHRRHHRPRDQPQLRRPGRPVRRRRPPAQLVDAGRPRPLPGLGPRAGGAVQPATARSPTSRSTASRCCRENIADIAGLNAAYDAYRLANGGKEGAAASRASTGDQQFFIAFAQSWRTKIREAPPASARSPTATPRPSSAPTPCATWTPGTRPSG